MYGNVAANAQTVNVYSIDNVLVSSFTSQVACAKWLDVSEATVRNYVKSGKVFRKQYLIVRSRSRRPCKVLITFSRSDPEYYS
jgi:hypothetical protein